MVVGCWLLVIGCWLLVVFCWLLLWLWLLFVGCCCGCGCPCCWRRRCCCLLMMADTVWSRSKHPSTAPQGRGVHAQPDDLPSGHQARACATEDSNGLNVRSAKFWICSLGLWTLSLKQEGWILRACCFGRMSRDHNRFYRVHLPNQGWIGAMNP